MAESGWEISGKIPWLPAARWFPATGGDGRVVLYDIARIPPGGRSQLATAQPTYAGLVEPVQQDIPGEPARFFLPLSKSDGGFEDASRNKAFVAWLVKVVLAEESLPGGEGRFEGRAVDPGKSPLHGVPLSIADVGGDASNTSLAVSWSPRRAMIVKLVRRCRSGVNPEVEVGRFLAESPVRADVPRLIGWLEYVPRLGAVAQFGGPATLAIVHERVEAEGSAWEVMMASATADWPRCLSLAASLGQTTARLHAALASRDDEPAFAPEPWTADAWAASVRSMELHATRVLDRLERLHETLPADLAADLAAVASARSRIMAAFSEQATEPPSTHRIRVHGDYHLGQVLVGRGDDRCVVIDFEGEPARSLAERREKTSAAKDVAGMCRSFDYLLRVLAKNGRRPYSVGDLASLESTFLSAYETTSHSLAAERPEARWWSKDRRETDRLRAIYKLDKALYEVAYEADHRPDWLEVPLAAIAAVGSP